MSNTIKIAFEMITASSGMLVSQCFWGMGAEVYGILQRPENGLAFDMSPKVQTADSIPSRLVMKTWRPCDV